MKTFLPVDPISADAFFADPHGVIDKMNYEGAGAVVEAPNGQSVVVMPTDWLSVVEDQDFRLMLLGAVRYSLGRHTYMPDVMSRYVEKNLELLDEKTITQLIDSVQQHLDNDWEHEPYPNLWRNLLDTLTQRRTELKEGGHK